jgi:mono/diheme cytochrome c family protein
MARTLWFSAALLAAAAVGGAHADTLSVADAAALYQRNCAACHGERGDGRSRARDSLSTKPRDFSAEEARAELPRDYMLAIVRDGKYGRAMAGRKGRLSEEQIEGVVDFIRAAFMPPAEGTPAARGRELYRSTCAGCHGDRGQGGIEHGTLRIPAISRALGRPGLDAQAIAQALASDRHGTLRGGFSTKLTAEDREAIVTYVRTAFVESSGGQR